MNQLFLALLAAVLPADVTQYKEPPAPIPAILDGAPSPEVRLSPDKKWLLVLERPALPPISEVSAPELRLAGIRINPRTYAGSRDAFMTGLKLIAIPAANRTAVTAIVTSRSVASEGCAVVATSTKVPSSPIATPA